MSIVEQKSGMKRGKIGHAPIRVQNLAYVAKYEKMQLLLLKKPLPLLKTLMDYRGGSQSKVFQDNIRSYNLLFFFTFSRHKFSLWTAKEFYSNNCNNNHSYTY